MDSFKDLLKMQELYILGVSGGCDSMALLDMMNQAGYQIIVCHVNYHLREDSDLDQQTVEAYCHDMICLVMFEKLINKFTDRIISKIKLGGYAINFI